MRAAAAALLALLAGGAAFAQEPPAYVGSGACADCHLGETAAWTRSHHAQAWMAPDAASVLGDFDDARFTHRGVETRFLRDGDRFVIETEDASGARRAFDVVGTAGIYPLQQYLIAPSPGRTQTFDVAWDAVGERWYHVFPDQEIGRNDGLHWTGPYKSWEARCAECHATGYSRNYDPAARTYAPEMAETGVGCEACHGPGAAHVAWAEGGDAAPGPGLGPTGLIVDLAASAETQIQTCAGCHSLREALDDGIPLPGTPYHDAFSLARLRPGSYEADGTILGEVYVTGSFLQSKMYAAGVRCTDCHEPHSGERVAEGNAVCTQCHAPGGNPRFPTLTGKLYDDPSHHFHEPGSAGAQCQACHMPERAYMGIDARSDHSFRVPRPDVAQRTGGPDTCTDCHEDRDAGWAAAEIAARFPDSAHRGPHFATTLMGARWAPEAQIEPLLALAGDAGAAAIVRATALEMLAPVADAGTADRAAALLADPDPLVRAAAAATQGALPPELRVGRLQPLLADPLRAVRVAAARALVDARGAAPDPAAAAALAAATAEWQTAVRSRSDFPETHLQMGGLALTLRDTDSALAAFREAVTQDPQLVDAWVMMARIHAATGRPDAARAVLDEALAANPGQPLLGEMRGQL